MGYQLGIDFGTSTTKVALRRGDEIPLALPIGKQGELFMPSIVAYRRTKRDDADLIAVGEDAAAVRDTEKTAVVREVKRFLAAMGTPQLLDVKRYGWWSAEETCIRLWSSRFSPEDVILSILNEALERAVRVARELGFGNDIDRFTLRGLPTRVGCPVSAGLNMRRVLAEVARRLGFPAVRVGDVSVEPILASLPYAHLDLASDASETVLVYDLGGGSFDTAVVRVERSASSRIPVLTVFAADGEPFCGGSDIDEAFSRHLLLKLAGEYLGFSGDERERIVELLTPEEMQQVRNQAREAKETLSTVVQTTIAFPPGFLGEASIALTIDRSELESVVRRTKVVDRTVQCVLRAWRRARMVLRTPDEAPSGYYLKVVPSSGVLGQSVLKLGHEDLRARVQKILLVGGVTRMPVVREHLTSLWGEAKLVSEAVAKPVEAAAIGGAWQEEEISSIVDRFPFSVVLRSDNEEKELYRAFEPTVYYRTLTSNPLIRHFRSAPLSLPAGSKNAAIVLRSPDGEILSEHPACNGLPNGSFLEIDVYGRCVVMGNSGAITTLENPHQHPLQAQLWERLEQDRKRREADERARSWETMTRSPFLDND